MTSLYFEGVDFEVRPAGDNRITRVRNATYPTVCLGYAEATPQFLPLLRSAGAGLSFDSGESIFVTIDAGGPTMNTKTITFTEIADSGLPTAAWVGTVGDSNIVVTVHTTGTTTIAEIATALDSLTGVSSTTNTGDYTDGVDNAIVGTFAGGHDAESISSTNGIEIVNLADMPDEWWALVREDGANVRVTDALNNAIPFDLPEEAFSKTGETGYLVLRRAISGVAAEPVRCWVCLQSVARFPVGAAFGQYASYPPWMIAWWPTGYNPSRTEFQVPAPSGPANPFDPTFDTPGPGPEDDECQPADEPYLVVGVYPVIVDSEIMWLSTQNNDGCAAPADLDAQSFGYVSVGSSSFKTFLDIYQLEWHPTVVNLNETNLNVSLDTLGGEFGGYFMAALKLKTVLGWELLGVNNGEFTSIMDSAIPDDKQTSIIFGDTNDKISNTDFFNETGVGTVSSWTSLNSVGDILFKAIIANSTDFEELDAMRHVYDILAASDIPGTTPGDWASQANTEYWGAWAWNPTEATTMPDG